MRDKWVTGRMSVYIHYFSISCIMWIIYDALLYLYHHSTLNHSIYNSILCFLFFLNSISIAWWFFFLLVVYHPTIEYSHWWFHFERYSYSCTFSLNQHLNSILDGNYIFLIIRLIIHYIITKQIILWYLLLWWFVVTKFLYRDKLNIFLWLSIILRSTHLEYVCYIIIIHHIHFYTSTMWEVKPWC